MRRLYFAVAALIGTFVLFVGWLADHERQAGIERLWRWRPQTSETAE